MSSTAERAKAIRSTLPPRVRLIAVTKGVPPSEIGEALKAGITEIGESKVQEAEGKNLPALKAAHPGLILHFIGHLQRNKAREAVELFDVIQSVDSLALAQKLAHAAAEQKKPISILLQFRISGKDSQFGYSSEAELAQAVSECRKLERMHAPYFRLEGLMGIGSREHPRGDFKRLRQLAHPLSLPVLSMGMSQDWEIAVEEGATMVRIGSAIFGD